MPVAAPALLIAELESAVKGGPPERRIQMLRRVTALFLSGADRLNENQVSVFDDVLIRLMERMEARTLAQLSATLCGSGAAPREVVRQLAHHEEASVAVPVLARSSQLSESDLIKIASTRGQQHLRAISGREMLKETVTDVLLKNGDTSVSHALANNTGARFSEFGYATLVESAEKDGELAEKLGLRLDIPADSLRELLSKATAPVRARLLKAAPSEMREKVQQAIRIIAEQISVKVPAPVDYTRSEATVLALNRAGRLGDQTINRFAVQGEYSNIIAALSLLSSVKIEAIEPLISNSRPDGLIVACKASRLDWSTAVILRNRPRCTTLSKPELEQGREIFETLSLSVAQQTIQIWSERRFAKKPDPSETAVAMSGI